MIEGLFRLAVVMADTRVHPEGEMSETPHVVSYDDRLRLQSSQSRRV